MFEVLQQRLGEIFKRLTGRGILTAEDVDAALREVRLALLEADVNVRVAKEFVARVREAAIGQEIWRSLTPGQMVIKLVHEELTRVLGGAHRELRFRPTPPTVFLLVGLHGTGKTTTAGKLGLYLKRRGRYPLLVAADLRRPAAVEQLAVVGQQAGVDVYRGGEGVDPLEVVRQAVGHARQRGHDVVIVDSAGRHQVDEELMEELRRMRDAVQPQEVLLVVDAMTGQGAVGIAEEFNRRLGIDGIILTKLDGDARGGGALSIVSVTGRPILFVGVGERVDALEPFHPDRMASRILGMGDVLTLVEKAQEVMDADAVREMERKLRRQEFTLEDFLVQLRQLQKMGPLEHLLQMVPGLPRVRGMPTAVDDKQLKRIEAIINSMTPLERRKPEIIDGSRRRRIARGSGVSVQEVNRLLRQFEEARQLLRRLGGVERRGKLQ